MYTPEFDEEWGQHFDKLDNSIKMRIAKRIGKVLEFPYKRHLRKPAKFFVAEIGQYRILYRVFEDSKMVRFYFVGNHKEYEKWYRQI